MAFSRLVVENKMEAGVDYMNPRFFEIIPKDQFLKMMKATINNPFLEMKLSLPTIKEIGEVLNIENTDYVKIKVLGPFKMKVKDLETDEIQEFQDELETTHGKENVSYDKETGFFVINATKEVIGSSMDGKKNWKFVEVDSPDMKNRLKRIVPAEILD